MADQVNPSYAFRALIIDDSAHIRILVSKFLRHLGFETVETAENGRQGLEKIKTFSPDVIFLDGIMPEMDGITVLRNVKKENPNIYVVITSSLSEHQKILEFRQAGADYYLLKPFDQVKFEETAKKVIAILESRKKEAS